MLAYVRPAMMLASCASMKGHVPTFGEPFGRPKRIPAGVPGGAKPWMCENNSPDAGGTVMMMLNDSVLASVSITNVPDAIAGVPLGGVSWAASIVALKLMIVACAPPATHSSAATAAASRRPQAANP